jgi:hypothetical protein
MSKLLATGIVSDGANTAWANAYIPTPPGHKTVSLRLPIIMYFLLLMYATGRRTHAPTHTRTCTHTRTHMRTRAHTRKARKPDPISVATRAHATPHAWDATLSPHARAGVCHPLQDCIVRPL